MTTYEEKLVIDNMNLAYDLAWKYYKKFQYFISIEDLQSISMLGLVKASKTFDINLGNNFSTYAYKVIHNEILLYYHSNKKYRNDVSLYMEVDDNISIIDMISDDVDVLSECEKNILIDKLYNEIDKLPKLYKQIIRYHLKGYTFTRIGEILDRSQPQISTDFRRALNILRYRFKINRGGEK